MTRIGSVSWQHWAKGAQNGLAGVCVSVNEPSFSSTYGDAPGHPLANHPVAQRQLQPLVQSAAPACGASFSRPLQGDRGGTVGLGTGVESVGAFESSAGGR